MKRFEPVTSYFSANGDILVDFEAVFVEQKAKKVDLVLTQLFPKRRLHIVLLHEAGPVANRPIKHGIFVELCFLFKFCCSARSEQMQSNRAFAKLATLQAQNRGVWVMSLPLSAFSALGKIRCRREEKSNGRLGIGRHRDAVKARLDIDRHTSSAGLVDS